MAQSRKRHVVVIDDRPKEIAPFLAELESRPYEVSIIQSASGFIDFLSQEKYVDLFVVDVMMYGFEALFRDVTTQNGLVTGLLLGRFLRENGIEAPIVFYSQASLGNVTSQI